MEGEGYFLLTFLKVFVKKKDIPFSLESVEISQPLLSRIVASNLSQINQEWGRCSTKLKVLLKYNLKRKVIYPNVSNNRFCNAF